MVFSVLVVLWTFLPWQQLHYFRRNVSGLQIEDRKTLGQIQNISVSLAVPEVVSCVGCGGLGKWPADYLHSCLCGVFSPCSLKKRSSNCLVCLLIFIKILTLKTPQFNNVTALEIFLKTFQPFWPNALWKIVTKVEWFGEFSRISTTSLNICLHAVLHTTFCPN